MKSAKVESPGSFDAWLAKYTPIEQAIFTAREKRLANAERRRNEKSRRFGDLCEATEGLAVVWRRKGTSMSEQVAWACGDVFTLLCLARYHHRRASRDIDRLQHQLRRPFYYAAENARRRALAEQRRKVRRRTTDNPCPTREQILDAWVRRGSSHADAIRFGSLIEDLECYLDNTLIRNEDGGIVGRRGGVKRWLQEEIPALYFRYTTVMRYKAAAKKLRQIAEVHDPTPAAKIVENDAAASVTGTHDSALDVRMVDTSARADAAITRSPTLNVVVKGGVGETKHGCADTTEPAFVLRARAIWREVEAGVRPSATALMERLDAFLDPERVAEASMLAEWRAKYKNEITVRTKS